jgi:outer membrane protein
MMKRRLSFLAILMAALLLMGVPAVCLGQGLPEGQLSLKQVVDLALQNSLQYRLAKGDVKLAEAKQAQAHSGYLPQLTLSGGVSRLNEQPDLVELQRGLVGLNNALDDWAAMMAQNTGDPYYTALARGLKQEKAQDDGLTYYGIKLRLEQPLYTGGKLSGLNAQAKANLEAAHYNLTVAEQNLVWEVTKAYYTVLQAQHLTETLREAVLSMTNHLHETEQYYRAGIVAKLDVLRAEVKLAELQQDELAGKNGLKLAWSNLKFVMGVKTKPDFRLVDQTTYPAFNLNLETCQTKALKQRADLKALNAKAVMAANVVKIANSGRKPTVGLVFDYDHTATELFSGKPDTSVGVLAKFKLYDGGLVKNQILEAKHQLKQVLTAQQLAKDGICLEVEQAFCNAQNDLETIRVATKNLGQAKETLRVAKMSYEAGLITSMERIDAETGLTQAKNNYHQAVDHYHVALARLRHAMGE